MWNLKKPNIKTGEWNDDHQGLGESGDLEEMLFKYTNLHQIDK